MLSLRGLHNSQMVVDPTTLDISTRVVPASRALSSGVANTPMVAGHDREEITGYMGGQETLVSAWKS